MLVPEAGEQQKKSPGQRELGPPPGSGAAGPSILAPPVTSDPVLAPVSWRTPTTAPTPLLVDGLMN